jgi:hypothetical protein
MGKSDIYVFQEYEKALRDIKLPIDSAAFLGFSCENSFTKSIHASTKDFYDLSLNNWDINTKWSLPRQYDLIVSTRCPYFSKDPYDFLKRCKEHLASGGKALIDWGLGDHWRFKNYKVGWMRENEHEYAYSKDNHLYSCIWRDDFIKHPEVKRFWDLVRGKFGYEENDKLEDIVRREIPCIVDYNYEKISFITLWPESPQLYIITTVVNE